MHLPFRRWVSLGMGSLLALSMVGVPGAPAAAEEEVGSVTALAPGDPNVLVFHGPAAEQDDPVAQATAAIEELGAANGFEVDASSDPAVFTAENLANYRSVVFLAAEGATLSEEQEAALQAYIRAGNGFVGVRDAAKAQEDSSWFTDLIGARPAGITRVPEAVETVTANGPNPANEPPARLIDGDLGTKWLAFAPTGLITVTLAEPTVITEYALGSANDSADRDPQDWTLEGSTDGTTWVPLDSRTGEDFPQRFQLRTFDIADNTTPYQHYRLTISRNSGATATQMAEFQLFTPEPVGEPEPEIPAQEAVIDVLDRQHPATDGLPLTWTRTDKWTNWEESPVGEVHTLAQLEEKTYDPGDGANGAFHPISWCRDFDGGRSFYTGMGGTAESYSEDMFRSHLTGAILWTTGMVRGDCKATIGSNYQIERLTAQNQTGELDQIGEPHGLTVEPESGKVFYVGKAACPSGPIVPWEDPNVGLGCGTIHQYDPETDEVKLLTTLDVMGNRGSGSELVKNEEGLLGIVTDPNFTENGWIYVYWMPHESIDRERRVGLRTVSRLTYDSEAETLDQATRVDLLQWETQIHSCCHAGGGMAFDDAGNLYIGSGDSNSSQGSEGYSGNNWTEEYAGISFQDARRTSGNTNDLNGKIIRIHPEDDGTYTIPEGNLFTGEEEGGGLTRPEIYIMGVRNIARLQIDADTDWLTAGWVGPDAGSPSPIWGPAKYDTAHIITSAGNQGWPFCMGNNQPYRNRSNEDASIPTNWYDCENLENTSPRNTGLVDIPDSRTNMIWYSPSGGGPVFPLRDDGSGIPTYEPGDQTFTEPWIRGGGQAVMSGPTYRSSQVDPDSDIAWPSYWEGKWLLGDQSNPNNRLAVTVDPDTVGEEGAQPVFAEDIRSIIRAGGGSSALQSWMDAKFGADGALYMLDYAGGFFSLHNNQKLIRINYTGGPATPEPAAVVRASGDDPMTYEFNGSRSGGVSWAWDFGDGATSTEANPTHTYAEEGDYTATLTVTYADGETSTTTAAVSIGGYVPLFDGTAESLEDWEQAGPGEFVLTPEGNLRTTGGLGMLWYAGQEFGDFSLRLQFRDMSPGSGYSNSGVFTRFPDPRTPLEQRPEGRCDTLGAAATQPAWVAIYCGHEIQIYDGPTGEPQKTGSVYNFDPIGLAQANPTPKGEWNDYEIRVEGQTYTMIRNGVVINTFENAPGQQSSRGSDPSTTLRQFASGFIGLQNHGNNDVMEFRKIAIRELNEGKPTILATATPANGVAPLGVTFTGTATDPQDQQLTYSWDFNGDGTEDANTLSADFTYAAAGTYIARLTVTDTDGNSAVAIVSVTVEAAPPPGCEDVIGPNDEFEGTELSECRWTVVRENPSGYRVEDGALQIDTLTGEVLEAPNLVLQPAPAGDFEASTRVTFSTSSTGHQAGMLMYADPANYDKVVFVNKGGGVRWIEHTRVINNQFQLDAPFNTGPLPADFPATFSLRMARDGDMIRAYYSVDGTEWIEVGQARTAAGLDEAQIGLLALRGPSGAPVDTATFDWFRVTGDEEPTDTTAPTVTATLNPAAPNGNGGYYTGPVSVTLAGADDSPGAVNVEYRVNGGDWTAYTTPVSISADGDSTVEYRATDAAGNVSAVGSSVVKFDATNPVVTVMGVTNGASYAQSANAVVSFAGTDATSGMAATTAMLDGQVFTSGTTVNFADLAVGQHSLVITSTDNAGNVTTSTVNFTVTAVSSETTFDSISELMDSYMAIDRLNPRVAASLQDRLDRAQAGADAGSEERAMNYLRQFVARAKNQVKGDAQDIEVRNELVAMAEELIARYQALEDAENA